MKRVLPSLVIITVAFLVLWTAKGGLQAQVKSPAEQATPKAKDEPREQPRTVERELRAFMRAKLGSSTKILEGLAMEDFDLLLEGAVELNKMSSAEKFRRRDDVLYRQFSAEFQTTTADLVEAARGGLLDRAALKWMDATMNCIECHRYVRNKLVAGEHPETPAAN